MPTLDALSTPLHTALDTLGYTAFNILQIVHCTMHNAHNAINALDTTLLRWHNCTIEQSRRSVSLASTAQSC